MLSGVASTDACNIGNRISLPHSLPWVYPARNLMKLTVSYITFLLAISFVSLPVYAQERENRRELEPDRQEQRERNAQARRERDQQMRFQQLTLDAMWEEFKASSARAPEFRLRLLVEETEQLAEHIEELYSAAASEDLCRNALDEQSENIEETSNRLTELVS